MTSIIARSSFPSPPPERFPKFVFIPAAAMRGAYDDEARKARKCKAPSAKYTRAYPNKDRILLGIGHGGHTEDGGECDGDGEPAHVQLQRSSSGLSTCNSLLFASFCLIFGAVPTMRPSCWIGATGWSDAEEAVT
ncbi:hypothetical protein PSPO01_14611 [Paraphaeosphaeria sporulosa]